MSQPRVKWMATCASWTWGLGDEGVASVLEELEQPSNKRELMDFLEGNTKTFLRSGLDPGKSVKLEVACGEDLLVGETSANPLESLDATLSGLLIPLIDNTMVEKEAWGQCNEEQKSEFTASIRKISTGLGHALKSMRGGIELRGIEKVDGLLGEKLLQYAAVANYISIVEENPDVTLEFESLVEVWSRQVEQYLENSLDYASANKIYGHEPGPKTEIDFWMRRMQKITAVTEQLKSKSCRAVFGTLHAVTRVGQDVAPKSRQVVFNTLRRWNRVEFLITEAFNEAQDNVKYLNTLEKFMEPLYTGTPDMISDSLPALLNAIKMVYTIARYYNTTERLTNLFTKMTNQMIINCKAYLLGDEHPDKLWETKPVVLIKKLRACLNLNEVYQEQYHFNRKKLLALPKGKQFDFSETQIFGRFDLFCRRVLKLVDMFSTVHQFESLAACRFDGMEQLVVSSRTIMEEFRNKRHDLLDFHNNRFDRDYVEFN
ncbi:hypothetical protein Pmar_PMAR024297, partial [Perkinsus marinus ATCC 50983]